jgi:hypothetical protein
MPSRNKKEAKVIIAYDIIENTCKTFTTKTRAAREYNTTTSVIRKRIKTHKMYAKRYLFFESKLIRDENKAQNKGKLIFARANAIQKK